MKAPDEVSAICLKTRPRYASGAQPDPRDSSSSDRMLV
jgi:hypothetical protein